MKARLFTISQTAHHGGFCRCAVADGEINAGQYSVGVRYLLDARAAQAWETAAERQNCEPTARIDITGDFTPEQIRAWIERGEIPAIESPAAALGRKGGSAKTEAKAAAARANGAKGGRPIRTPGTIGDGYYASDSIEIGEMVVKLWAKPHGETVEFLCRYTAKGGLDRPNWPLFAVRGGDAAAKIRRRLAPWEPEIPELDGVLASLESQISE